MMCQMKQKSAAIALLNGFSNCVTGLDLSSALAAAISAKEVGTCMFRHFGGGVQVAGKRVTLADVAKLAGLSTAAASMILTGRTDTRLSAEAHAKVHAAAAELGYRPNLAARALRTDKTRTIAVISDHVATTRYASGLIRGVLAEAEKAKHVVLLLETGGNPARGEQAIQAVLDRQVDGIIFAAMRSREVFVPDLPISVPVVMLNGTNARFPTTVLQDEYAGGRMAIRLLAESGVTDGVVLLGYNEEAEQGLFRSATITRRLQGISDEMRERSMTFDAGLSCWEWEPNNGYELMTRHLKAHRPKGLICLNDRLAIGAYQALAEAGLKVLEDVGIISFDDDELAQYLRPGLTTIRLPHDDMGAKAVELLLNPGQTAERVLVPMPAVIRGSLRRAD
jgi:LacI family transcriptional regulator